MEISQQVSKRTCPESEIYNEVLSLDDKRILELGCGAMEKTRLIAENFNVAKITAVEIDPIQHEKNLQQGLFASF